MPTHAELAGKLLKEAAEFFKTIAKQNPSIGKEMGEQAATFEQMSHLITKDPQGKIEDKSFAEMSSKLLEDAAAFFRALGKNNAPVAEQMEENAAVFEQIAALVLADPAGILE